jgi:hypothetical protein
MQIEKKTFKVPVLEAEAFNKEETTSYHCQVTCPECASVVIVDTVGSKPSSGMCTQCNTIFKVKY